jgi:hypothetical protein
MNERCMTIFAEMRKYRFVFFKCKETGCIRDVFDKKAYDLVRYCSGLLLNLVFWIRDARRHCTPDYQQLSKVKFASRKRYSSSKTRNSAKDVQWRFVITISAEETYFSSPFNKSAEKPLLDAFYRKEIEQHQA